MSYGTHSRSYLVRARQRLDEDSPESLFYAAFELRCGIESRLQQYEEALIDITKMKKAGWRIPKVAKNIEKGFRTGDKIAQINVRDEKTESVLCSFYYTPINKDLRRMAGQIGKLLHTPQEYRAPEDHWWNETRILLELMYKELMKANRGTLLCVPLLNPKTGQIHFQTELNPGEKLKDRIPIGQRYLVTVDYLDNLPET